MAEKYFSRWPDMKEICQINLNSNELNFEELTKTCARYCKKLRRFLTLLNEKHFLTMDFDTSQNYQEFCIHFDKHFYFNTLINIDDQDIKSLLHGNEITYLLNYHFLINELENIIKQPMSEHKELTNIYYSKMLLPYLHYYHLKNFLWQTFINKPAENQLLEEAAIFLAQWYQPEKKIFSYVQKELDNIMIKAKDCLKAKYPMHPIFSISDKQLLFWKYNELDENQWSISDGKKILDVLCTFFSSQLIFHKISCHEVATFCAEHIYINHVLEKKVGCGIVIGVIFQSIARRFGIRCDFILPHSYILIWKPEYNTINRYQQDFLIEVLHCRIHILSINDYFSTHPIIENLNTFSKINSQQLIVELNEHFFTYDSIEIRYNESIVTARWIWELTILLEPNNIHAIEQLCLTYIEQMINPLTFITAWQEMSDVMDTQDQLNDIISLLNQMQNTKKLLSTFYTNKSRPKRRRTNMKFAIGMMVRIEKEEIGVIIGWQVLKSNYNFNIHSDPRMWWYTVVCKHWILEHIMEDSLERMDVPQPIDNNQLGKYFCEFKDTYYVPNERMKKEYPNDLLYIINNL